MKEKADSLAINLAMNVFMRETSNPEFELYRNDILEGDLGEDWFPLIRLPNGQGICHGSFGHFYNPTTGNGLDRGWLLGLLGNALRRGVWRFNQAVKSYHLGDFKKAHNKLGRSLHYLDDLSIPAHARAIPHASRDGLEMWLEKEVSNNLVEGEYNGLLINGVVEITRKENVRDYFHDLAVESAKHEATIPFNR